jgi:hypothetical protein
MCVEQMADGFTLCFLSENDDDGRVTDSVQWMGKEARLLSGPRARSRSGARRKQRKKRKKSTFRVRFHDVISVADWIGMIARGGVYACTSK